MNGVSMSLTSEFTIEVNVAPITIPTAMSTMFPFNANSLNSFSIFPLAPKPARDRSCDEPLARKVPWF